MIPCKLDYGNFAVFVKVAYKGIVYKNQYLTR